MVIHLSYDFPAACCHASVTFRPSDVGSSGFNRLDGRYGRLGPTYSEYRPHPLSSCIGVLFSKQSSVVCSGVFAV